MGWSGYRLMISVRVDAHAGEKQQRGEAAYAEFLRELEKLCADERWNNDAITVDL